MLALGGLDALVQRLLVVVVGHRHGDLGDDRAGVDAGVDDEQRRTGDLDAVGERVPRRRACRGTTGSSAGWVLTMRPPNRARNAAPMSFMKPARTTRSGSYAATVLGERGVPVVAGRGSPRPRRRTWGCPPRRARARPSMPSRSAPTADDPRAVRRVGARRRAAPAGWCRRRRPARRVARLAAPRRNGCGPLSGGVVTVSEDQSSRACGPAPVSAVEPRQCPRTPQAPVTRRAGGRVRGRRTPVARRCCCSACSRRTSACRGSAVALVPLTLPRMGDVRGAAGTRRRRAPAAAMVLGRASAWPSIRRPRRQRPAHAGRSTGRSRPTRTASPAPTPAWRGRSARPGWTTASAGDPARSAGSGAEPVSRAAPPLARPRQGPRRRPSAGDRSPAGRAGLTRRPSAPRRAAAAPSRAPPHGPGVGADAAEPGVPPAEPPDSATASARTSGAEPATRWPTSRP